MRLGVYWDGEPRIAVAEGDELFDLRELYALHLWQIERVGDAHAVAAHMVPADMALFIRLNHDRLGTFDDALAFARAHREELQGTTAGGRSPARG